ncbi:MAG: cytochrome-c oxidase, cbb3-type subunit III [Rhodospirillaceae bacterium]|nr:cytochrome-c oxidase, cbb3-type subunit III [Rhodospirillaceae bacterium]
MTDKPIDDVSGVVTTGHEWDGIRELDTPMPRWWLWTYYACVIWAIGYWIAMPAWPLVSDYTRGVLGHSQRAQLSGEIAAVKAGQADLTARTAKASLAEIKADAELLEFALAGGRSAYAVNCSQCHGSGAAGSDGYPNLNDDDWIWGGTRDSIHTTVSYGIRSNRDDARDSEMPNFLGDEVLEKAQIADVAEYVVSLSGGSKNKDAVKRGAEVFEEQCVACHGEDGKGLAEMGGPNLTDAIWLYSKDKDAITAQISGPKHGVMPAWVDRLSDVEIKQVSLYVHSLGGGQ